MSLINIEHCLMRAAECERLAASGVDPHYCEMLLMIASRWKALAQDEQAYDVVLQNAKERVRRDEAIR